MKKSMSDVGLMRGREASYSVSLDVSDEECHPGTSTDIIIGNERVFRQPRQGVKSATRWDEILTKN